MQKTINGEEKETGGMTLDFLLLIWLQSEERWVT